MVPHSAAQKVLPLTKSAETAGCYSITTEHCGTLTAPCTVPKAVERKRNRDCSLPMPYPTLAPWDTSANEGVPPAKFGCALPSALEAALSLLTTVDAQILRSQAMSLPTELPSGCLTFESISVGCRPRVCENTCTASTRSGRPPATAKEEDSPDRGGSLMRLSGRLCQRRSGELRFDREIDQITNAQRRTRSGHAIGNAEI